MGNWRTVHIVGTCDEADVPALKEAIRWDIDDEKTWRHEHALSASSGLMALGDWAAEVISVTGNCFERDYDVLSVASALEQVVETVPSLEVKIHCGDENESLECVATITATPNFGVIVGGPEMKKLPEINPDIGIGRMMRAMQRPQK